MLRSFNQGCRIIRSNFLALRLTIFIFFFLSFIPSIVEGRDQQKETKSFVESIAGIVYAAAWPTATYEKVAIKSIEPLTDGCDVLLKLSGKSGLDGSNLWLVLVFRIQNGELTGVKVKDHNAFWSPPFETTKAIAQVIADVAEEQSRQTRIQSQNYNSAHLEGFKFFVKNECYRGVNLALKYKKLSGEWSVIGWWSLNGNSSQYLTFEGGTFAKTKNSVAYYFAETQDRKIYWGKGDSEVIFDGRNLPMTRIEDKDGDTEITLICSDQ